MKIILKEKYRKLGEVGDVIDVKSGFARNFLIPTGIAVQATNQNIKDFESRKSELIEISKKKEAEAEKVSKKISDNFVIAVKQASDDGRLYGSVATSEIADSLNANSDTDINRKQITISTAIKFLGIYQVEVDLGEGVLANVYVNVARSEAEAKEAEEKFKKGKISLGPLVDKDESQKEEAPRPENLINKNQEEQESEAKPQEADSSKEEAKEATA
jgi:large subunit ribosomal protein L9